jgi:probable rRNA maturation factor
MPSLSTRNMTRSKAPSAPFVKIAKSILPKHDLSLVFVGETTALNMNKSLRKKTYVPNVLAYEIGKNSGEVIICLSVAKKQAPSYGMSYSEYAGYLFIHALLHLKGYPHGATMDKQERAAFARINGVPFPNESTNRNRNRYRNSPNENRRRRGGKGS